jgi:hypothetical protein
MEKNEQQCQAAEFSAEVRAMSMHIGIKRVMLWMRDAFIFCK